ncbi:MAG: hypothetical protein ACI8XI_000556 [Woeseiaceae bacterium]|jgi:hypothetical protein|tara:strand:+ start:181 stop:831 length:651 start_codon:yes stop_codon:yes gene_type:complete
MRLKSLLLIVLASIAFPVIQAQEVNTNVEFHVDSDSSWLRVLAYPDGPLRRFGHNHVISHQNISGTVLTTQNPLDSMITLELQVTDFEVDNASLRKIEGADFAKEVSQKDIDGTRVNMLAENLLDAEKFPIIKVFSSSIDGNFPNVNVKAVITIKGEEHNMNVPSTIEIDHKSFVARGYMEVTHGDLGLTPFSAAGGALTVRDLLVLKYEIFGKSQ